MFRFIFSFLIQMLLKDMFNKYKFINNFLKRNMTQK